MTAPRFIPGVAPGTWVQCDPTEQRYPAPAIFGVQPGPDGVRAGEGGALHNLDHVSKGSAPS